MWYWFSFISLASTVLYGLVSKRVLNESHKLDPVSYASPLFLCVGIASIVVHFLLGGSLDEFLIFLTPSLLGPTIIVVLLYSIAPSFYWRALKQLPLSETTILYSMTGVYILIIGITLGLEGFSPVRTLGAILVIFSIVLVLLREGRWKISRYTWMMIFGTAVYAVAALTDNFIIVQNNASILPYQAINFSVPAFLILILNPKSITGAISVYKDRNYLKWIFVNAFFYFVSFFSIFKAYEAGGATSQVNIFLSTETIVLVILSAIFLKERENLKIKLLAAIIASLGVYLIK
jgi:drug/metabolite transporter (DMT)-like permease